MNNSYYKYIKRCYELAINAGKKGYETFGALLVYDNKIIAEAENTSDYKKDIFGHAEFNLVHKCANKFSDKVFANATFYASCAPCPRCLMAIASLGIKTIVYGVSYKSFQKLLPFEKTTPNYEEILEKMDVSIKIIGPVLEDEGMHVFEYWNGNYQPLNKLIKEMDDIKRKNKTQIDDDTLKLEQVIETYTKALDLLDDYDHHKIIKPLGSEVIYKIEYEEARKIIDSMKFNSDSTLFGMEKEQGKLDGILQAIYQNVFETEIYPSIEEKAAHLLYFIVKDHPFIDGCKRIAATLFLQFLNKNNKLKKNGKLIISNNTLVAITLLTAESKPSEKETIINVIMHLLKSDS